MGDVEEVQPSAENVDPTFHARLMALRADVDAAPQDTSKLLELAHLHQDAHQMAEAAELYKRVLAIVPQHRQTHLDLALCYSELGQWEAAQRTMQQMLEAHPDDPSALYNLGAIHANQGQFDEARDLWRRVQAQTEDVHLASQASASLAQIDAMAAAPPTSAAASQPGAAPPPSTGPPPVPLDHYEPVIAGQ
jgi:tetratricopeptide (TPR) repeat protein